MIIQELTGEIIDYTIKVHNVPGPGLFESVYEEVIIEIKSVEAVKPVFKKQVLIYD